MPGSCTWCAIFVVCSSSTSLRLLLMLRSVITKRAVFFTLCAAFAVLLLSLHSGYNSKSTSQELRNLKSFQPIRAALPTSNRKLPDPIQWLQDNSDDRHAVGKALFPQWSIVGRHRRPRAAIISLVRNTELPGIMQSMRQLEFRWNRKYQVHPKAAFRT